jgi:hypothetical protein
VVIDRCHDDWRSDSRLVERKVLDIIAAKPAHRGGHERDANVGGDKSQCGLQLTDLEANLRLKAKFAIE